MQFYIAVAAVIALGAAFLFWKRAESCIPGKFALTLVGLFAGAMLAVYLFRHANYLLALIMTAASMGLVEACFEEATGIY